MDSIIERNRIKDGARMPNLLSYWNKNIIIFLDLDIINRENRPHNPLKWKTGSIL